MTHRDRERETVRRLREEWDRRHCAERIRQKETEALGHATIQLDEQAEVLFELSQID